MTKKLYGVEIMALREGWNFHNDVALPLERIARRYFAYTDRPVDTIFDADCIEGSTFVEAMIVLLNAKFSNKHFAEKDELIIKCKDYLCVGGKIDNIIADKLFGEFEELFKK
jgi:hypothetical protein